MLHAFSVLVDFRNLCAHDERLYCAKAGLSHDLGFVDMLEQLSLVLPSEELSDFVIEISKLFGKYSAVMRVIDPKSLLDEMGISTIKSANEGENEA